MSITINIKRDNGGQYDFDIPTEWKDMTLKYWSELATIIKTHHDNTKLKHNSFKERYAEDEEDLTKILESIEFVDNVALNGKIFSYMSGISAEDMKNVDMEKVTQVIELVGDLTKEYEPKGIRSFDFEGETYYFPSDSLKDNTYGDFIESTSLDMTVESMKHGKYDILPQQMAILCRRAGEDYDEEIVEEKSKKFKNLTMDIVYEFAFFLTNQSKRLLKISNMYSEKKEKV